MKITRVSPSLKEVKADAIVVGAYRDAPLAGPAAEADEATRGLISRLIDRKEITGKLGETLALWHVAGVPADQLMVVGLGERRKFDARAAFTAAGAAANRLAGKPRSRVAFLLAKSLPANQTESAVVGAMVGCHGQDLYRAEKSCHPFEEILFAGSSKAIRGAAIIGEAVNLTRHLVNEPPQEIYPETFAKVAEDVAEDAGLEIEVWDQSRLEAENCGSLLAVARASVRPPRLVIMRHHGGRGAPLALVGKGVTFDSGGLSLKSSESMKTMKCDMAGAATVLGAMSAIGRLKLPVNVVGLMGLVENMPGGAAVKLGDVLHARSGKTIEVLNTDAEGRLVLADVLNVAVEHKARRIIDLATLTGSCVVALGNDVAGLFTNDQPWCDAVRQAAAECGEPAWQLPMFEEFGEEIKSEVADIKNLGAGRWGGAITAAKFLEEFVDGIPWVHIDIAGPAFLEKPKPYNRGGASGAFVQTLVAVGRREA